MPEYVWNWTQPEGADGSEFSNRNQSSPHSISQPFPTNSVTPDAETNTLHEPYSFKKSQTAYSNLIPCTESSVEIKRTVPKSKPPVYSTSEVQADKVHIAVDNPPAASGQPAPSDTSTSLRAETPFIPPSKADHELEAEQLPYSYKSSQTAYAKDQKNSPLIYRPMAMDPRAITTLEFSPDGEHYTAGYEDGIISLLSVNQRKLNVEPLAFHKGEVKCMAFSRDGSRLASVSVDPYVLHLKHSPAGEGAQSFIHWRIGDFRVLLYHQHTSGLWNHRWRSPSMVNKAS